MIIPKNVELEIARAMCGDDHIACTYPDCGCKIVPARLPSVMAIIAAALSASPEPPATAGETDAAPSTLAEAILLQTRRVIAAEDKLAKARARGNSEMSRDEADMELSRLVGFDPHRVDAALRFVRRHAPLSATPAHTGEG